MLSHVERAGHKGLGWWRALRADRRRVSVAAVLLGLLASCTLLSPSDDELLARPDAQVGGAGGCVGEGCSGGGSTGAGAAGCTSGSCGGGGAAGEATQDAGPDVVEVSRCENDVKDENEIDFNCGGACPPCGDGRKCVDDRGCQSQLCDAFICRPATCDNGVTDGAETDVDCGGRVCARRCAVNAACAIGDDCASRSCKENVCVPASCFDEVQNGNETDVNCGGPDCTDCKVGQKCELPQDCEGANCREDYATATPSACERLQGSSLALQDCACEPCSEVATRCGTTSGCSAIFECAALAHCASWTECYGAGEGPCAAVIDRQDGPTGAAATAAGLLVQCAVGVCPGRCAEPPPP